MTEDIGFNLKTAAKAVMTKTHIVLPVLFVLIAFFFAFYLRAQPHYLPVTYDWAENSVHNHFRSQIEGSISAQYPNLPEANKQAQVERELSKLLLEKEKEVESAIKQQRELFKSKFKDDDGNTYLLAIDPYVFMLQASNIENKGIPGDEIIDGQMYDFHMIAPVGRKMSSAGLHSYIIVALHQFFLIFSNISLMGAMFWLPAILCAIATIPAFLLGRRISGNVGGLFASVIVAANINFLGRTAGGFADTDAYNVLMPLIAAWLVFEGIYAVSKRKRIIYSALGGLSLGIYSTIWVGWWTVLCFVTGSAVLYTIYKALKGETAQTKDTAIAIGVFILTSAVFVSLFSGFGTFLNVIMGPFDFMRIKDVATIKIWPNVYTTVAELNSISLRDIFGSIAGASSDAWNSILFFASMIGIVVSGIRWKERIRYDPLIPVFLFIWYTSTIYASTKGVRFMLLIVPAFALSIGAFAGKLYEVSSRWAKHLDVSAWLMKSITMAVLLLMLISPIKAAINLSAQQVPSMNDDWYGALTKIKENSAEDAIITSWWDFGHWFKVIADRPVTFDGGTQNRPQAHWVGNVLLSDNESVSFGILRMLDCGAHTAFDELAEMMDDDLLTINTLYEIIVLDKEKAKQRLIELEVTDTDKILSRTHCTPPQAFFITSEDMVGKAGVWGHFGSWDFEKALMYKTVKPLNSQEGIKIIAEEFNKTDAAQIYNQIQTKDADKWIAPWPGYLSGEIPCKKENETLLCRNSNIEVLIDLLDVDVLISTRDGKVHPSSLTYPSDGSIIVKEYNDSKVDMAVLLFPPGFGGNTYRVMLASKQQAGSTFTKLFFYDGYGMKCFSKFDDRRQITGGRIVTWEIDWTCSTETGIDPAISEVKASHILIKTDNRTDEDALAEIITIKDMINGTNFADVALEHSEGPSSVRGGDLGWFGKGVMVQEFEEAAFLMDEGEVSEPVKTQFGYHLIMVSDKR